MNKMVAMKQPASVRAYELLYEPDYDILRTRDMRDYQLWMADLIYDLKKVFLGAEMGLGKTGSTLRAIVDLIDDGKITHVLIVAPLRVAEETWPAEIRKWAFARHLRYRVVTGNPDQRKASLNTHDVNITIVNRENLRWLRDEIGVRKWPFDMIVYDEASRLQSGRLKTDIGRKTELGILTAMAFKTEYLVLLSGTPAPRGLLSLWGPIYAIDQGRRLGTSLTAFRDRWFKLDYNGYTYEPFLHSEGEIMSQIKDVFFSLREADYLDLPPMIERDHKVHLEPKVLRKYREFERDAVIEVVKQGGEKELIEAVNSGVLTGKLLQYANGSMYVSDREAVKIHTAKLDALDSIVSEAMGRPILVAYSFQFDKDAIKKRFPFARIFGESKNDMRDWNAGRIRMLVTHPASAGHGLNFQQGSNIAVWYGLTWSIELYQQFIKRLHRSGQKADKVYLHRIITAGTADETILPNLTKRGATQDSITNAVRVRLKRYRNDATGYRSKTA